MPTTEREVVKTTDDLMVRHSWFKNKRITELVAIDPNTGEVTSVRISPKVAELLEEYGMSSGS